MSKSDNSYKSILKGTSIFGGVKLFELIINLVRGKFVAIFLGPVGIGISSILSNVAATVSQLASCGLNLAIVKEIAANKDNPSELSHTIGIGQRLFLLTALFGALICLLFSPSLSVFSFGSDKYLLQFLILSSAVFFMIDNGGKLAVLQGLHEVKRLSKASLVGSLTGLLIGVPLYWKFGNNGIGAAIASLAISQNIFYRFQLKTICREIPPPARNLSLSSPLVKRLFSLGIILLLSDVIGSVCNYLLLIAIRKIGNIDDVGFFQSANSVTNQLAGVVFTAMALDYFPRLSAVSKDTSGMNEIVDRQSEIVALIIMPVALILIPAAPLVVKILLTEKFDVIVPLLRLMAIGVVVKALAFPMGYISFAKDNKKVFFWLEGIVGNMLFLFTPLIFFKFFGLIGFGYGMIAEQSLCFLIYLVVNRRLYQYKPSSATFRTFIIVTLLSSGASICSIILDYTLSYILMGALAVIGCCISIIRLKARLSGDRPNQ